MSAQLKLRLRPMLHNRLKASAKARKHSLNAEIVRRLEESYAGEVFAERLSDAVQVSNRELEKAVRQLTQSLQRMVANQ